MSDDLGFSGNGAEFICSLISKRSVSSVLGTVLGIWEPSVTKKPKNSCPGRAYILVGEDRQSA